jgi:hypothetical protein
MRQDSNIIHHHHHENKLFIFFAGNCGYCVLYSIWRMYNSRMQIPRRQEFLSYTCIDGIHCSAKILAAFNLCMIGGGIIINRRLTSFVEKNASRFSIVPYYVTERAIIILISFSYLLTRIWIGKNVREIQFPVRR